MKAMQNDKVNKHRLTSITIYSLLFVILFILSLTTGCTHGPDTKELERVIHKGMMKLIGDPECSGYNVKVLKVGEYDKEKRLQALQVAFDWYVNEECKAEYRQMYDDWKAAGEPKYSIDSDLEDRFRKFHTYGSFSRSYQSDGVYLVFTRKNQVGVWSFDPINMIKDYHREATAEDFSEHKPLKHKEGSELYVILALVLVAVICFVATRFTSLRPELGVNQRRPKNET